MPSPTVDQHASIHRLRPKACSSQASNARCQELLFLPFYPVGSTFSSVSPGKYVPTSRLPERLVGMTEPAVSVPMLSRPFIRNSVPYAYLLFSFSIILIHSKFWPCSYCTDSMVVVVVLLLLTREHGSIPPVILMYNTVFAAESVAMRNLSTGLRAARSSGRYSNPRISTS